MSEELRPYPEYRESGLHWLGRIPEHWKEKRAKYFLREVDERSTTGDEQLMSVSHKTGVTPRKSNVTMFKAASNVGHKICRPGDVVINTLWAWMAALGVSRQVGLVSPAYGVYRQRDVANYHPDFIDFLLRTPAYAAEYRCRSTGITTSRLRLYPVDFLRIPIVQPPLEEQELIVSYLRRYDLLVRKFIRNRRRLMDVLNEQKQELINQTVTRGLDANVPLKFSGVSWLGDPEEYDGAVAGYDMVVTVQVALPRFIATALLSRYMLADQPFLLKSRAAQPHLNAEDLGSALVVVPPESEQELIVERLDEKTASLNCLIDRAEREIDSIREYRTRLVADVVTGKLDVRHLAPPPDSSKLDDLMIDGEDRSDDELPREDQEGIIEDVLD